MARRCNSTAAPGSHGGAQFGGAGRLRVQFREGASQVVGGACCVAGDVPVDDRGPCLGKEWLLVCRQVEGCVEVESVGVGPVPGGVEDFGQTVLAAIVRRLRVKLVGEGTAQPVGRRVGSVEAGCAHERGALGRGLGGEAAAGGVQVPVGVLDGHRSPFGGFTIRVGAASDLRNRNPGKRARGGRRPRRPGARIQCHLGRIRQRHRRCCRPENRCRPGRCCHHH